MTKQKRCIECGGKLSIRREARRYGRQINIVLDDVEVRHCSDCGEEFEVIPNIEGLHKAIAISFAKKRGPLSPGEIRFLRTYLGYSSQDFARTLGVRPETVTRWEHPRDGGMTSVAERFLRVAVLVGKPIESYELENIDLQVSEDPAPPRFFSEGGEWVPEMSAGCGVTEL